MVSLLNPLGLQTSNSRRFSLFPFPARAG